MYYTYLNLSKTDVINFCQGDLANYSFSIYIIVILHTHKRYVHGKHYVLYSLECSHGMYGHNYLGNCIMTCKVPERCDRITGHCNDGCQAGWTGFWCEEGKIK